jgi:NADPH:quinone reductase-like Zn-dependent oxidoreductase
VIAAGPGAMLRSLLGKLAPGKPFISFLVAPRGADGESVAALVEAGKLQVVLDRRFPLAQLGEAHAYVERGRTAGKVAIEIP